MESVAIAPTPARAIFLSVAAVAHGLLGAAALVAPPLVADLFGIAFEPSGATVARLLGATLLGFAVALFGIRNCSDERATRALLVAGLTISLLSFGVVAVAIAGDVMGPRAWVGAAVRLVFAVGFGWFALAARSPVRAS